MPSFRVPVHARGERETVGYTSVSRGPDRSRFHAAKTARGKGRIGGVGIPQARRACRIFAVSPQPRDRSIAPIATDKIVTGNRFQVLWSRPTFP